MQVRIVVPTYYPASVYGGPTFSIHNTAQALARQGVDVRVSTTDANRPHRLAVPTDKPVPFDDNYEVRYYRENITDRLSLPFMKAIGDDLAGADIIHLQDVFSSYALQTLWINRSLDKPIIVSPRGVFSAWALAAGMAPVKKFWIERLFKPLVRGNRALSWHATSVQEAQDIRSTFPGAEVFTAPNGVELAEFQRVAPLPRDQWLVRFAPALGGDRPGLILLISMGRIHPVKGFDIAVESLAQLITQGKDCVLIIAGKDDGAKAALKTKAAALGLADRLHFAGEVLDQSKVEFLSGGDYFLFPSHSENFGLACLEAMAAGTPVIASRETPWEEVEAAGAGVWADNNPSAITAGVNTLLTKAHAELRANARAHDFAVSGR